MIFLIVISVRISLLQIIRFYFEEEISTLNIVFFLNFIYVYKRERDDACVHESGEGAEGEKEH